MFDVVMAHHPNPPKGRPSPFAWGDTDRLHELLDPHFEVAIETATSTCRAPDGQTVWDAFANGYGPVAALLPTLEPAAAARLRDDFIACHERYRTPVGILVERPYVIVVGRRRGG